MQATGLSRVLELGNDDSPMSKVAIGLPDRLNKEGLSVDGEQHDVKKPQSRQFALGAAAAIVGIAISIYMTGVVGAVGIVMLAIGFGGLGPGLAYLMGNRSINFLHAMAFRACMNILMIAVIVLFVYKGVPIVN